MKIQIDTDAKVIKLDSKENLGKLFILLDKMVENWKDYSIDTNTTITWQNPIYIDKYPYWRPYYHSDYGRLGVVNTTGSNSILTGTTNANNTYAVNSSNVPPQLSAKSKGTYNLEIN